MTIPSGGPQTDEMAGEGSQPGPVPEGPGPAEPTAAEAAEDATPPAPSGDVRQRVLRRFELWLDEVLADEQPPDGLDGEILSALQADAGPGQAGPGERGSDLYTLWSALIGLSQETRLQGRAFKQLHELLSPLDGLADSIGRALSAGEQALSVARDATDRAGDLQAEQLRQAVETTRQETRAELLDVLLDLRDRLVRGSESAGRQLATPRKDGRTWLGRLFGAPGRSARRAGEVAEALLKGYTLSLKRLEEALAEMGVSEIPSHGQPFDPHRMTAVDLEDAGEVPDGTVTEVYRAGYEWHGRVHRLAEVRVARSPADSRPDAVE
jgi:hypothetical protein